MKQKIVPLIIGMILGAVLFSGNNAQAAVESLTAVPSTHSIYLDGQRVTPEAYVINGSNYVRLRDIGELMGFNVYWDGTVQIDSTSPYTGQPSAVVEQLDSVRQELIQRVNQVRRENGVPELTVNDALMDAAQACSDKLYTYHHNREECEAVASHGYPYGFGSNITVFTGAATTDIAQRAVTNWINSPDHFRTMIDSEGDSIGVGVTEDQGRVFCYLFVGKPNTYNPYG